MSAAQIEGQAKRRGRPARLPDVSPAAMAPAASGSWAHMIEILRADYPDIWNECRTWPTESGLAFIAERLK